MVITSRVHTTFFAPTSNVSKTLIRLPPSVVQQYETRCEHSGRVLVTGPKPPHRIHLWSSDEHDRFLQGLEMFPNGPWKEIAAIVGTKTTRQTMTHAQKYRQKIERRLHDRPVRSKKRRSSSRVPKHRTNVLSALEKIDLVYGSAETLSQSYAAGMPLTCSVDLPVFDTQPFLPMASSPVDISYGVMTAPEYDSELVALLECLEPLPLLPIEDDKSNTNGVATCEVFL